MKIMKYNITYNISIMALKNNELIEWIDLVYKLIHP